MTQATKSVIGRARELRELEGGLHEALGGNGGLFLLVGEPGIGKTRLADELCRRARERGFAVHWGRCWEVGGAPAYWPWIQIFRSMLRDPRCKTVAGAYSDVLERLLPELRGEGSQTGTEALDRAAARFQLFDELWALLRAIAEQAPVLLVLDDLHAADPSSLALLQFVVRDLRANRVVVIATYRDREAKPTPEVTDTIRDLTREGTFLPLRRLNADEVSELLDQRAGKTVAPDLAAALHKATEGNPLFVDQVYRMLEARAELGAAPAALPIPEGMRDMIKKRLGALDGPTRSLLEAAAVVGRDFTRPLLASVCELEEPALLAPLQGALDSGMVVEPVLGAYEFSHALFREALYRDLPAPARSGLHARVASVLEASGAPEKALGEIAAHLLAGLPVVGPERATEGCMRAGKRALDVLAFEDAATIFASAVVQAGPALRDEVRGKLLVALGEARARMGDHEGARKACEEAAAIARSLNDPTLLAEAAIALGVELLPGVISSALVALLEEAKTALPSTPTPLRARVLARLAAALQPAPNPDEPIIIAREAVSMARTAGDRSTLRACLHMGGSALVDYAEPLERHAWDDELLSLSTEAGDTIAALRAHMRLFFDYLELGRVQEADAHMAEHERIADGLGLPTYRWLTLMMRSLRAIWDGRFEDGTGLREQARRVAQRVLSPEMEMTFCLQSWGPALARGEPLPNVQRVQVLGSRFPGSQLMGLVIGMLEHARQGDTDSARELLTQIPEDSAFLSCLGPHLRFVAETTVRLGERRRAAVLFRTLGPFSNRMWSWGRVGMLVEGPVSWLCGMLAGVLEQWDDADRLFEDALARTARSGMRPYEAIACLEYARVLTRRGAPHLERRDALLGRGAAIAAELAMTSTLRSLEELTGTRRSAQPAGAPPAQASAPDAATARPSFTIEQEGETWAVSSGGRVFRLKDSRGMRMLHQLIQHPAQEFHVLTLMGSETPDAGDAGEVIDRQAANAYRERLEDLKDQLEEAESFGDTARAARVRGELERIADELSAGVGLGGRSRRAGAAAERARINVQRRLREAIRRIGEQDAKLGRHLDRAVRTGTFCAYEPD
jgi:tetratricopeptide (TPR) repeat protein